MPKKRRPADRPEGRTRAERSMTHAIVETHGGNTILALNNRVWVKVGDRVMEKQVVDLQRGDKVLERAPHVRLSLNAIQEALLREDAAYQADHRTLHEYEPGTGTPIPKLQQFLLDTAGLTRTQVSNSRSALEAARNIRTRIYNLGTRSRNLSTKWWHITPQALERSERSITSWITGQTVLPSDPRLLRLLRTFDVPRFERLFMIRKSQLKHSDSSAPTDLLRAHRSWRTSHQTLTRWISGFSRHAIATGNEEFELPSEEQTRERDEASSGIPAQREKLAEQRRLIYERLITPVYERARDTQYGFTAVKGIQRISTAHARQQTPRSVPRPLLPRGVLITERVNPEEVSDVTRTNPRELLREGTVLSGMMARAFDDLSIQIGKKTVTGRGMLVSHLLASAKNIEQSREQDVYALSGPLLRERLDRSEALRVVELAFRKLNSGELDQRYGLPKGTLLKAQERTDRLLRAIPVRTEINQFKNMAADMPRIPWDRMTHADREKVREEIKRRVIPLIQRISSYGIGINGVPIPERENLHTLADLQQYAKQNDPKRWKEFGVRGTTYMELPPTSREVVRFAKRLAPTAWKPLVELYGKRNFIRLPRE
ncbi:hypothetical protein KJ765_04655 [Candidatus Micrarchaeota archaeon]|nr:hypothetical protein [Candidatus Micrarchaeota archaeon]